MTLAYNPYDFANPVNDKYLFVGRVSELEEVSYYLDEARSAPRPISLALMGPRAAGKTSFLNIIDLEARSRQYCPVRIDLNEGDVRSEHDFFFKLFDAVLGAACSLGAFGGTSGKTYDTYLDMVYALQIPDDRTFCPFLFPIQYAKVKSAVAPNTETHVSDNSLKRDLTAIHSELKTPIILLFDEGNVLAKSRVILEKIRNLFMNTSGFMLVLTGTPDLFPVIDDVFSPIIRQFKKIHIGAFRETKETSECIRAPLLALKNIDPSEIIDLDDSSDTVREIHQLSSGRPYEVKLICHMLFRRVQQGKAARMVLDFSVLEDVRKELETYQDISERPILASAQRLTQRDLGALALLCSVEGRLTFEEVWSVHYVFNGERYWTKDLLRWELELLVGQGLLEGHADSVDKIRFRGDEFDKIYIKYLANERGVVSPFWLNASREFVDLNLARKRTVRRAVRAIFDTPVLERLDIVGTAEDLADPAGGDPFSGGHVAVDFVYKWMLSSFERQSLPLIKVEVHFAGMYLQYWIDTGLQGAIPLPDILELMAPWVERSASASCKVHFEQVSLPVPDVEILAAKVVSSTNASLRRALSTWHVNQLGLAYVAGADRVAEVHAELGLRYADGKGMRLRANLGYFALVRENFALAETLLDGPTDETDSAAPLVSYNLAMLRAKQGRIVDAVAILEKCVDELRNTRPNRCVCLVLPIRNANDIELREERGDLSLSDFASKALSLLSDGAAADAVIDMV